MCKYFTLFLNFVSIDFGHNLGWTGRAPKWEEQRSLKGFVSVRVENQSVTIVCLLSWTEVSWIAYQTNHCKNSSSVFFSCELYLPIDAVWTEVILFGEQFHKRACLVDITVKLVLSKA